jgi:hypothetical protein
VTTGRAVSGAKLVEAGLGYGLEVSAMSLRIVLLIALMTAPLSPAHAADSDLEHSFRLGDVYRGITFTPDRADVAITGLAPSGNGKLLVVLTGIGTAPAAYGRLMHTAVDGGYHALGLDWVNGLETDARGTNVFYQCNADACFEGVWHEAFDGSDQVPKVRIGVTDSVLNRLTKALSYLARTWPDEGWDAFLADDQPVWSKIALAGLSNGAGEAAYIASRFSVARVAMFAGPMDSTGDPPSLTAASWLSGVHATPASLWFAFASEHDASRTFNRSARYLLDWGALGLGQIVTVEDVAPPFGGAHALLTGFAPCDGCSSAANMLATDQDLVQASGEPAYRSVWEYMLGISAPVR